MIDYLFGFPIGVLVMVVIAIVATVVLSRTTLRRLRSENYSRRTLMLVTSAAPVGGLE